MNNLHKWPSFFSNKTVTFQNFFQVLFLLKKTLILRLAEKKKKKHQTFIH